MRDSSRPSDDRGSASGVAVVSGGGRVEAGPDTSQAAKSVLVKPVEEECSQVLVMLSPCPAQQGTAFAGEERIEAAAVAGRAPPLDESAPFEPVGEAGEPAA